MNKKLHFKGWESDTSLFGSLNLCQRIIYDESKIITQPLNPLIFYHQWMCYEVFDDQQVQKTWHVIQSHCHLTNRKMEETNLSMLSHSKCEEQTDVY